jgi:SAM-dependent methyltransferase
MVAGIGGPACSELLRIPLSSVLRKESDFQHSVKTARDLGLPIHDDLPKNWDSLAAVAAITRFCPDETCRILDAGGEVYSSILPQLEAVGYKNLTGINLTFKNRVVKRNRIRYEYGDITKTKYPDGYFGAITCLSVIEHGVEIAAYFKEMSRILSADGILFTSTDFWHEGIDVKNKFAYGVPIKVFSSEEVREIIEIGEMHGFELIDPLDLYCEDKVVDVKPLGLQYTFMYFTLRRRAHL